MHEYMRKLLLRDLNRQTVEKVTCHILVCSSYRNAVIDLHVPRKADLIMYCQCIFLCTCTEPILYDMSIFQICSRRIYVAWNVYMYTRWWCTVWDKITVFGVHLLQVLRQVRKFPWKDPVVGFANFALCNFPFFFDKYYRVSQAKLLVSCFVIGTRKEVPMS